MNVGSWLAAPRRWRVFSLALILLGLAWAYASRAPQTGGADRLPSPRSGFPAPLIDLETLTGARLDLAGQRGQVVVVNIWASWCGPCRAEMPALNQVYQANRERGLQVLAVNSTIQDSQPAAAAFVQELGLAFPVLLDVDGEVTRRYLVRALPSTFFVDRRGVIRTVVIGGPLSLAALQTQVEALLQEAP